MKKWGLAAPLSKVGLAFGLKRCAMYAIIIFWFYLSTKVSGTRKLSFALVTRCNLVVLVTRSKFISDDSKKIKFFFS